MKNDTILRGIAASFGIAIGPAFLFEETGILLKGTTQPIENTEKEIIRFKQAIKKSKKPISPVTFFAGGSPNRSLTV